MARVLGWLAVGLLLGAGLLPVAHRIVRRRRAAVQGGLVRWHVVLGFGTAFVAYLHALYGVLALGAPAAVAAGNGAILAGAVAVLVVIAHVGIGLQLRQPPAALHRDGPAGKILRRRLAEKRTALRARHRLTATVIVAAALVHVLWLLLVR